MISLAFLSTAHIHTKSFLETVAGLPDVQCLSIWDDVADRGKGYAERFDTQYFSDLQQVLDDDRIDGYIIMAENTRHLSLLEKAIPVGKPILCEKPLATTVADARQIAALVEQHNTTLTCGYMQPFFAPNRAAKQLIDDGKLGKVTHAHFRNAHHAAYGRWFDSPELQWFTDPELAGGGGLMDMGAHAVHLLRHLCGPVEQVWAMVENVTGVYPAVDDYGVIQMKFANGVIGRVEAGWCFTGGGHNGLEVIGSEAAIWSIEGHKLAIRSPQGDAPKIPEGDWKPDRVKRLIAAIRGDLTQQELAEDLDACIDEVAIMAAAYASAEIGEWVEVESI
jgi:predicted dehydrogenase